MLALLIPPLSTISLINTHLSLAQITAKACCLVTSLVFEREMLLLLCLCPCFSLYFSNNNVYTTQPSKFLTARPLMMALYEAISRDIILQSVISGII